METFLDTINNVLDVVLQDFLGGTSKLLLPAKLIAGLGCLISSYFAFFKMMEQKSEAMEKFLTKFICGFLGIFYYGTLISFINLPLNVMSESVKQVSITDDEATHGYFSSFITNPLDESGSNPEKDKAIAEYLGEKGEQDTSSDSIWGTFLDIETSWKSMIMEAIYSIFHFLGQAAILILSVIRVFFLIVLTIFGIFVIALSMYPGLEGSFYQWLQKYINVYLWLPIGYILQGIISKIFMTFNPITTDGVGGQMIGMGSYSEGNMVVAFISLCSIIGFATVPTMSSWLINAATNGLSSKMTSKGSQASTAAKSVIKAGATGNPTAAVPSPVKP